MKEDLNSRERESYKSSAAENAAEENTPIISSPITRRRFLKRTGGAAGATALALHGMRLQVRADGYYGVESVPWNDPYANCVEGSPDCPSKPLENSYKFRLFWKDTPGGGEWAHTATKYDGNGGTGLPPLPAPPAPGGFAVPNSVPGYATPQMGAWKLWSSGPSTTKKTCKPLKPTHPIVTITPELPANYIVVGIKNDNNGPGGVERWIYYCEVSVHVVWDY